MLVLSFISYPATCGPKGYGCGGGLLHIHFFPGRRPTEPVIVGPPTPEKERQKKEQRKTAPEKFRTKGEETSKERQDRGNRSAIPEHGPHRQDHRASLFAQPPNPLPHGSCLAGLRRAPRYEAESGLALAGIAEPAPVRVNLFHSFEVGPDRSMAG